MRPWRKPRAFSFAKVQRQVITRGPKPRVAAAPPPRGGRMQCMQPPRRVGRHPAVAPFAFARPLCYARPDPSGGTA